MTHEEFARGLRLLPVYRAAIQQVERRTAEHWWASMAVECPRKVIYRRRGCVDDLMPDSLPSWARKEMGEGVELAERKLLDLSLPNINRSTFLDAMAKNRKIKNVVDQALSSEELTQDQIAPFYISQLPFIVELGLKDPISCKVDFLILAWDRPVVLEVKSTGFRGQKLVRDLRKGKVDALYPSWVAQLGLYTHFLDTVGLLHIWTRGAMEPFELPLYWHAGELWADGTRLTLGGLNVLEHIKRRLAYLEVALEAEEDLFPIEELGPGIYGPRYPSDFPTHHGDQYRLVINSRGRPTNERKRNGETETSYRCLTCEARNLCYPEFFREGKR